MTHFYKKHSWLFVFAIAIVSHLTASSGTPSTKSEGKHRSYPAAQHEGLIGITEESPIDNPVDNIFHVNIDVPVCDEDKMWLVYDLEGVQAHTSVSRSINDQLSVGGCLIKRRRGWSTAREQVSTAWLKQGDNIVRFTTR